MHTKKFLLVITILVLVTISCSLTVNLPVTTDIKTGDLVKEQVTIPSQTGSDQPTKLVLNFAAGQMNLSAGNGTDLVNGTATYIVTDLKPNITISEDKVKIETGNLQINGIPDFEDRMKNIWDLELGKDPLDLTIKSGAYVGDFELGGLAITNLQISDGAAEVDLNFQEPNRVQMDTFRYETGASNVSLHNLANANFGTMIFQSGAGDFELDFSGELQRDATVFVESGLSSLRISVPENTRVELQTESGLTTTTVRGAWVQSGNTYTIDGEGPTLKITVEMNAGSLILDTP
jgi:hypothetical protein